MMVRRLVLIVAGAFSISVLAVGSGGAVVCDPHCAPAKSNQGGAVTGLTRANEVAGDHGQQGRDNAAAKQDLHKPGGSGVSTPPSDPPPPVPPPPVPPPVTPPPGPCTGC